jgi:hypothetical protein
MQGPGHTHGDPDRPNRTQPETAASEPVQTDSGCVEAEMLQAAIEIGAAAGAGDPRESALGKNCQ